MVIPVFGDSEVFLLDTIKLTHFLCSISLNERLIKKLLVDRELGQFDNRRKAGFRSFIQTVDGVS